MPVSYAVNSDKTTVPRWIKHFENQAISGTSSRSLFNRRLIVVEKFSKESSPKQSTEVHLPPIVSPVQQSVEQAKEEIKREVSEPEGEEHNQMFKKQVAHLISPAQTDHQSLHRSLISQSKKAKKRKIVHDIFSV